MRISPLLKGLLTCEGRLKKTDEIEEAGVERVDKSDIVLVQTLEPIKKMERFFSMERCFFS